MVKSKTTPDIEKLFGTYSEDIVRYAFSILRNIDDAKDTLQDVFLKYQLHHDSFNEQCSYKTWLFTITRNTCYNKLRESRRRDTGLDKVIYNTYEHNSIDDIITLENGLKKLSPDENEIIYLRDFEGYSYKDIAMLLEISLNNVKIRLFRAKKKLKNILKGVENESM